MRLSNLMYQIYDNNMNMVDIVDNPNISEGYSMVIKTDDTLPFYLNALLSKVLSPTLDVIVGTICIEGLHQWQVVYNKLTKKYRGVDFQTNILTKSFQEIEELTDFITIDSL